MYWLFIVIITWVIATQGAAGEARGRGGGGAGGAAAAKAQGPLQPAKAPAI